MRAALLEIKVIYMSATGPKLSPDNDPELGVSL